MENRNISRRTVAKGAAWAVPAVAVTSVANAATCSPNCDLIYDCNEFAENNGLYLQGADVVTWTPVVGTTKIDTKRGKGTCFDTRLGTWQFAKPVVRDGDGQIVDPAKITGYRVNWEDAKQAGSIIIQGARPAASGQSGLTGVKSQWVQGPKDSYGGNKWDGYFSVRPNSGPLVIGAGLVYTGTIQSTRPFSMIPWHPEYQCGGANYGNPYKYLLFSIPIRVSFLKGLSVAGQSESNECKYYVNYVMEAGGDWCGTYRLVRNGGVGLNMAGAHEIWISNGVPTLPTV